MSVAETSINSYRNIDPDKVENRRDKILVHIAGMHHPCNADLCRATGIPINCVTPRTNELVKLGLVENGGTKIDPFTNMTVKWWRPTEEGRALLERILTDGTEVTE